ncbi:MAG: (2Fe-2S)-binding protein [Candidatus Roseilinea sp.]|nr:MAG: (2Fe-2S)-binding protein [Candidatus Roseilinea sp.]
MLKNFWWPIEFSEAITREPKPLRVMGKAFWAYRQTNGQAVIMRDLDMATRRPLGAVRVEGDDLVAQNGRRYASDGSAGETYALAYPTQDRYGWCFVFFGDLPESERIPIPHLPYIEDTATYKVVHGNFEWNVHYARALENGVDAAHTPFVHGGAFGNPDEPEIEDYQVESTETSAMATIHLKPTPAKGLWSRIYTSKQRDTVVRTVVGWWMPNISILEVHLPLGTLMIYNAHVPVDDMKTVSKYIGLRTFFKGRWADGNMHQRVIKIFKQDQKVVEAQRPEILPYDLGAELHVRSDAIQIAFRKTRQRFFDRGWGLYPRGKAQDDIEIPSPYRPALRQDAARLEGMAA